MRLTGIVTLALATLAGCVTLDPATIATKSPGEICYAWAVARAGNSDPANGEAAFNELRRRGDISDRDLVAIKIFGKPMVGMSEKAAICAWGGSFTTVNTTTTARGTIKQYVQSSEFIETSYFYTENGVVTATQN